MPRYLIAQMAAASNMLDEEMFSVVIWALLWATVFAPFVFRYVLNNHIKAHGGQRGRGGLDFGALGAFGACHSKLGNKLPQMGNAANAAFPSQAQGLEDKPPNRSFFFWSESPRRWRGAPSAEKAREPGLSSCLSNQQWKTRTLRFHSDFSLGLDNQKTCQHEGVQKYSHITISVENVVNSHPQVTLPIDPKRATPEALEIMEAGAAKADKEPAKAVEPSVEAVATAAPEIEDPVPTMSPQSTPELSTASAEQSSKAHL